MWLVRLKAAGDPRPRRHAQLRAAAPPPVLDAVHGLVERPRVERPTVAHAAELGDGHHLGPALRRGHADARRRGVAPRHLLLG